MREILCLVLGGGRGARLYPLTKDRSKPAVPFAGKYRLVDIPISNSLNSGANQIYVLTQFNSESLNKHIARTYKLDSFSHGFVEIMAAEQSMESADWFQGSADAVRRCLKHFNDPSIKYILVLSGDQLYKMNFEELLKFHKEKSSEITIACNPTDPALVKEFGIMCVDENRRINNFIEKPQDEKAVKGMSIERGGRKSYLASMGIYLFNKDVLDEILSNNTKTDFGKEVIPDSFGRKLTYAYIHEGYWKDIGTIKAFYEENIVFTESVPPLDLFDEKWQFFTHPRYLPPAKIEGAKLNKVIIGEGSILYKCAISRSVIGLRSRVSSSTTIEESILMGADFYQSMGDIEKDKAQGMPAIGVGRSCTIKRAIIDKNARIGDGAKIINHKKLDSFETDIYSIKDGIVIIPKNTVIAPGTII
jgi:glucose-1-phosphate adenylyltransferase